MISGIGATGIARAIDLRGDGVARSEPAVKPAAAEPDGATAPTSLAATLTAAGAPVDADKVAAIKAQIADGSYRIDPQAIAQRMIELDLPAHA